MQMTTMFDVKNQILLIFAFKNVTDFLLFTPHCTCIQNLFFLSFFLSCKKEYAHIH